MKTINSYLTTAELVFSQPFSKQKSVGYFRKSVYSLLLLKILWLWPQVSIFYNHVLSLPQNYKGYSFFSHLVFLPFLQNQVHFTIAICAIIVLLGIIIKKNPFLSTLIFLVGINLMSLSYLATNGGDLLLNFFLLLLIFLSEKQQLSDVKLMINNAAWWILKFNICFLYFVNAYGKLFKIIWLNGDVMQTIWQLDYYANPHFVPQWFTNSYICLLTAWSVILFELAFPFLIWFKPIKRYLIVTGILFHLAIALCLSLPDFGLTMIIAYIPFRFQASYKKEQPVTRPLSN